MKLPVRHEAIVELDEAITFYEEQQPGLGLELLGQILSGRGSQANARRVGRYTRVVTAELRQRLRSILERAPDVKAAWLFGSVARGEAGPSSDVDVAIFLGRPERPRRLDDLPLDLEADLASAVGRLVQVVVVDWAPVDLVHRVLRDGVPLLDRDPSARIRFEVDARNRYFDMLPILREYRRQAS